MLLSVTEQLVKISWKHLARNAAFWLLEQVPWGTLSLIRNVKLTTNYLLTSALNMFNKVGQPFMPSHWWKTWTYVHVHSFCGKPKVTTKQWTYCSCASIFLEPVWLRTMYTHSFVQVWQPETCPKLGIVSSCFASIWKTTESETSQRTF